MLFMRSVMSHTSVTSLRSIGNPFPQVTGYVTYMHSTGTAVITAVVIACVEGILLQETPDLLSRVNHCVN